MIHVEKLNKTYDRRTQHANHVLRDVSFDLPQTGFVCILGPSGCGKTSLLNAIGGLDRFDNGTLATDSVQVNRYGTKSYEDIRNRDFGYIFQNYYLLPEHSVAYNIYLGLHSLKLSHSEKLRRIRQALADVDMSHYIRRKVGELSGGQQQRVAIARALARRPRVIFADEPTGNLDEANTMNICTLLRQISRDSLVVMVTHEERIAKFFADRIIRLDQGEIVQDSTQWDREGFHMGAEQVLYAGDYPAQTFDGESGVTVRLLQEEGAAPVDITVAVLKDRIVLKLSDGRAITCGTPEASPVLREGPRPVLTLETVEQTPRSEPQSAVPPAPAGHGLSFGMMLTEARKLMQGWGGKRIGMRIFLFLLAALTVWTVCDYLTLSAIDPKDFITTDSHVLEIKLSRGAEATGNEWLVLTDLYKNYVRYLDESNLDATLIPVPISPLSYSVELFPQMENATSYIKDFSYAPLSSLDPDTLVHGRMPERSGEMVVDRWVLENVIADGGIVENVVSDVSLFLGKELYFSRCDLFMTIVGICDSGEPSVYLSSTDLLRTCKVAVTVMGLSDFQNAHPGEYEDLQIADTECIVNIAAAGTSYSKYIGELYYYTSLISYRIKDVVRTADPARIIVSDNTLQDMLHTLCNNRFFLYCSDKAAVKAFLSQPLPEGIDGYLDVQVIDENTDAWNQYRAASRVRLDARTIVTVTVMLVSMVMLYLLCRSQAQDRIGMMAVYRLLGLPGRKLAGIFAMESLMTSVQIALPATAAVFLAVTWLPAVTESATDYVLPWYAALAVWGAITIYYLLVCLLPLVRLLKMPPAQLAAKYDY